MAQRVEIVIGGSRNESLEFINSMNDSTPGGVAYLVRQSGDAVPFDAYVHLVGTVWFTRGFSNMYEYVRSRTSNIIDHTLSKHGIACIPRKKIDGSP